MKTEVSKQRWKEAQDYEKNWWKKNSHFDSKMYVNNSKRIKDEIHNYINLKRKNKILQIGCGPDDVIHHFGEGKLYGIDPLMKDYNQMGILKKDNVKNIKGVGENLPFEDNFFDLIIINNVLDHCQNPKKVLEEINRCLKKEGVLYTETNVRPKLLYPFLKMVWWTKISTAKGHPYLFLPKSLRKLIQSCNFEILEEHPNKQKFKLRYFLRLRDFVQHIIEYQYDFICKRR